MLKYLYLIAVTAIAIFFSSCHQHSTAYQSQLQQKAPICTAHQCLQSVENLDTFLSHSGQIEVNGSIQHVMKIVYIRDPQSPVNGIYFFNTQTYPYHIDFVWNVLKLPIDLRTFNLDYTGSGENRHYNMGSLILFESPGQNNTMQRRLLLEMWSGDEIEGPWLKEFYSTVREKLNTKELPDFFYHPLNLHQEQEAKSQANDIRTITREELFAGRSYVSLNSGEAKGYITFIKNGLSSLDEEPCLDLTKIPVFERVPNELGLVAGVITSEFQTPLSHVNVKSVNRGTINIVLMDALNILKKYEGQPVHIKANAYNYEIQLLKPETADKEIHEFWSLRKPNLSMNPEAHLDGPYSKAFINLSTLFQSHSTRNGFGGSLIPRLDAYKDLALVIGAKAANLAALQLILKSSPNISQVVATSPDALGVPFDFYERFMNFPQKGLVSSDLNAESTPAQTIYDFLNKHQMLVADKEHSICVVKPYLAEIRDIILKSEVPPDMLAEFKKNIMDDESSPIFQKNTPRIRLRSSTNSEDLKGFTGAGLYNSDGISLYEKLEDDSFDLNKPLSWKKIEKKLKKAIPYVYSSIWNDRAFEEREWFGINGNKHLLIKAGIAVHSAFSLKAFNGTDGEIANGVAISKNIFDENRDEQVYINGQHYDLAITNPPSAEEFQTFGEDPNVPYLTEQILITTMLASDIENEKPDAWKSWTYEYLGKSSIKGGAFVLYDNPKDKLHLENMEVRRLSKIVKHLSNNFALLNNAPRDDFAVDVEWKLYGPKRNIVIKQARPFVFKTDTKAFLDSKEKTQGLMPDSQLPIRIHYGPKAVSD